MSARSLSMAQVPAHKPKWVFTPLSFCYSAFKPRKLVLYSNPGCCSCDGLKEKLHASFSLSGSDSLHDVVLQVRDIASNPEWEKAYQYEIPVLAEVLSDGTEGNYVHRREKKMKKIVQRNKEFKPPPPSSGH